MELGLFAGFGAFLGHLFPAWLGFKGGKGVATYLGVLIGLVWQVALIFAAVWLLMAILFRYSSLAALSAAVVVPIALWFLATPAIAGLFALMSIILIYKHRTNISRLMAGTEGRIGAKG
jgi:glycerol-3-phosphate acyltransferase PlsY